MERSLYKREFEKKTYVVVDDNNNWLDFNDVAKTPEQAYEQAKQASDYDPEARVFVYEVVKEYEFGPEKEPDLMTL